MNKYSESVKKGLKYENKILNFIKKSGLEAYRTNTKNPYDMEGFTAGFDGGIDIIATYTHPLNTSLNFAFFIQCKNRSGQVPITAISEAFSGKEARKIENCINIPVVIVNGKISKDFLTYANILMVEVITEEDINNIENPETKNNSILYNILKYHYTKDELILEKLENRKIDIKKYESSIDDFKKFEFIENLNFEEKKQLISTLLDSISEDLVNKEKECFSQCVYCKSSEIKKMGFSKNRKQRFQCRNCKKSFSEDYGQISYYSHLRNNDLSKILRAKERNISITQLAKYIGFSSKTVSIYMKKLSNEDSNNS